MGEFFRFLVESNLITAAFVIGAISFVIAVIGKFKTIVEPSPVMRLVLAVFGLFLMALSVSGYFLSSQTTPKAGEILTQEAESVSAVSPTAPTIITATPPKPVIQPTATQQSTTIVVAPTSPTSKYYLVSLRDVGKPESGNLRLQAGVTTLANVDFEIGWLATTQSQGDPDNPETIVINTQQNILNPSEVHFLLQASWAVGQSQEFGSIYIIFAGGRTINEPLKVGYNIRDWSQVNTPLAAPNAQQAWEGVGWDGHTKGIVDMLTVNIPSDYRQSQMVQIEIRDESEQKLNSSNPGIHLWAVTIER